jgi:hypothetical protein
MMKFEHKYTNSDKFDAHMPNKAHFVHDEMTVSKYSDRFHSHSTSGLKFGGGYVQFGVCKNLSSASSEGYYIDAYYVGKSDYA